MSNLKQELIEFTDFYDIDEENPNFDFLFHMHCVINTTKTYPIEKETRDFFNDLFPTISETSQVWTMISQGSKVFNLRFTDLEEALTILSRLCKEDYNLYFSPATFKGWRTDKNVNSISTVFIDIDDLKIDFSSMDKEEIKEFLMNKFSLPEKMLPNWIVSSGHGLHLYYLIDTLDLKKKENADLWLSYIDYLIYHFKADTSCRNRSRILRFPNSRNVKHMDDIRTTKLYHLNTSDDRSIDRLDFFKAKDFMIERYKKKCNEEKAAKRKATMEKNGTLRKKSTPRPKVVKASIEPKEEPAPPIIKPEPPAKSFSHPELKVITTPLPTSARYRRIVRDLHNYAARRSGVPEGHRAIFTHLMAIFLKRMKVVKEEALSYIETYLDEDFSQEAAAIIESVYRTKTSYLYTNERIAELLNFTEEDLKNSFSAYTEEQKEKATKKRNAEYHDKIYKEERAKRAEFKKQRYEYVKNNPQKTAAELAKDLDYSIRTIKRIRAQIRQDEKKSAQN